ncbi:MAG: ATP-grasp domain-containing protein [Gemmataceae bacterium]|nr:ATP-grasp domain-containing protein [Gemmataceae bacterium]
MFAAVVAQELDVTLLEPPFDWLPRLLPDYRRRHVRLCTLHEARQLREPMFVKPADDKCFLAGVFNDGARLPNEDVLPAALPVLIAEPVRWEVEFRCFLLERQVLTVSPYFRDGALVQSNEGDWQDARTIEASTFAQKVASDPAVELPPAVVVDVGIIENRGWAVIEANAAWGSGIYGCDPVAVLRVVRRACLHADKVSPADRKWIVQRVAAEQGI